MEKSEGLDRNSPENAATDGNISVKAARGKKQNNNSTRSGGTETKVDTWQKAVMAKIKKRYDKMSDTILQWEYKKKKKAKRRMDRIEVKLEKKKVTALKLYKEDIAIVNRIAESAQARLEKKIKNDEAKVKEKAKNIPTRKFLSSFSSSK